MKLGVGLGAAAFGLACLSAAAPKPTPAEPQPASRWAENVTSAEFFAALPEATRNTRRYGTAVMRCTARADGHLEACRLLRDAPPGAGYGPTLLSFAPKYRLKDPVAGKSVVVEEGWLQFDTQPDWQKKPRAEDILGVYPREALRRGVNGQAVISCIVAIQGTLTDCVVVSEEPEGMDFGQAAIALTPQLLMRPARLAGQPVPSEVRIPIKWARMAGAIAPASSRGVASPAMVWDQAPGYAEVAAAYPKKAAASKVGGRATLACAFEKDGRLVDCEVIAEEPKSQGFGVAAKTLSRQFRAFTATADGKGVKGINVHVPVVFDPQMLAGGPPVVGQPKWAGLPSRDEMVAAFKDLKVEGTLRAVLSCTVATKGTLADCRTVSQSPDGNGVGAAALSLTPKFRLTTWTAEGLPTIGSSVQIPIRYEP
jgi:TonB family protein